jgi:cardiolipin synthase
VQTFLAARKRLWITTPYFVPDEATRKAVENRARAGVDVRILMPDDHTDAELIRLASHNYYEELLRAGVRIYEYGHTMMHTKHAVVDGEWSVVGSTNFDSRSFRLNDEVNLAVFDRKLGGQLTNLFQNDLARSKEITYDQWLKRPIWERALGWASWMAARQQ